jgi:hypothetical protein
MTYTNFKRDLIIGEDGEVDVSVFLTDNGFTEIYFNKDKLWDVRGRSPLTGLLTDFEVKTDIYCKDKKTDTGNIAVEIRYRGNPSGVSSSHADYFVYYFIHFDKDNLWFISIEDLKKLIKENINELRVVNGGDNNWSEIVLIPRRRYYKHFYVYTFKY